MTAILNSPNLLMIRKLESIFAVTDEEKHALKDLPIQTKELNSDTDIVRIGDQPSQCCLVVEGFICAYKLTLGGKRQILALYVPGDIPDLQSLHLKVLDINIASISTCKLGFIQHEDMQNLCDRHPRLTAAFWRETLVHSSIFREWLLNIGQRSAYSRIAHLICELMLRLNAVGLTEDVTFDLPATQAELADATGMTQVHMNRMLQALKEDGLINIEKRHVTIPNWQKLKEVGEFDSLYLHFYNDTA